MSQQLNRRTFVAAAGAAVCAACVGGGAGGCAGGAPPVWTGPTSFDLGSGADVKEGIDTRWAQSGGFFLIREGSTLYAVASVCTHQACPLTARRDDFACPCHGSRFSKQGVVLNGPASRSLVRFGISRGPKGEILVDRTKQFDQPQWDAPGAAVTL